MISVVPANDEITTAAPLSPMPLEEYNASGACRRVSFRTTEIERREIASLAESYLVVDDDEDETDEWCDICKRRAAGCCDNKPLILQVDTVVVDEVEEDEEEDSDRGLELKTSLERQTRKFTILKSIVRNQRKCSPEQLAMLARVCNKWAAAAAKVQAELDYQQVYRQSSRNSPTISLPDMATYLMPFKQKRPSDDEEQDINQRRVRCRIN
jgi:hypothetical protein